MSWLNLEDLLGVDVKPKPGVGVALVATFLAAQPVIAWAATDVSKSYLSYKTDFSIRESERYPGPTGGQIRLCADQQGTIVGQGGSVAYIMRDNSFSPDTTNSSMLVEGGNPSRCTSYTSSSSNARYYTKVQSSYDNGGNYTGWAKAQKP